VRPILYAAIVLLLGLLLFLISPLFGLVFIMLSIPMYIIARRTTMVRETGYSPVKKQIVELIAGSSERAREAERLLTHGVLPTVPVLVKRENIVGFGRGYILYMRSLDAPFINMLPYLIYKYYKQYRKM